MPTDQLTKLNKLREILKMMDENISRAEFVKAFETVVSTILKIKSELTENDKKSIEELKSIFNEFRATLENKANAELSGAIEKLDKLADKTFKEQVDSLNFIKDKVKRIKKGKDGSPGKDGIPGRDGKDGSPDVAEQIRDKLEQLNGEERLDKSAIRGLEELIKGIEKGPGMTIFGGNRPLQIQEAGTVKDKAARYLNFTGATITRGTNGVVNVAIAGGTPVYEEIPTDSGDHLNFTLAHIPATGTFRLFRGGARQQATTDYTLTGAALVLVIPLATGEVLICDYNY